VTSSVPQKHSFADNQAISVANAVREAAAYTNFQHPLSIATGYFNLGGFDSIADVLEQVPSVRILIGAEPEHETVPDRLAVERESPQRAATRIQAAIAAGRDIVPFTPTETAKIERLKALLARPTTQVRIYRREFLHGKAFIFGEADAVIAGSANFTFAGLNKNRELDLGQFDSDKVKVVKAWFDALWDDADPFDLATIFDARLQTYDPFTIYLRMLYAQYRDELREDEEGQQLFGPIKLTEFQRIGALRAVRILDTWGGAMVADGVGLGKTVVAGEVMRTFVNDRGVHALIVCPAALRDMWTRYLFDQKIIAQVVSYAEFANWERGNVLNVAPSQYRLIVADEAHALRTPGTQAYAAMVRLLSKSPLAKLLLLTATPVNNSLWDLYHEVMLFAKTDGAFSKVGIPSFRDHVKGVTNVDPDDVNPAHMFAVLDAISVRRTRRFIKQHFANEEINGQRIVFPKVEAHAEKYDLDAVQPGLFEGVADAIENRLTMARYRVLAYALEPDPDTARQEFLSGLLRSQMLKRFESSAYAFQRTLDGMIAKHELALSAIEVDRLVPLKAVSYEALEDDDELVADDDAFASAEKFRAVDLLRELRSDVAVLRSLRADVSGINASNDPKLTELREILLDARKCTGNDRKVLIFTGFVDTVQYIHDYLAGLQASDPAFAGALDRAAFVLGNIKTDVETRAEYACGFAPESMRPHNQPEDRYDLLVTTDVLAEGQNLQQCGRVVNFDLPWNPMRVVQRNGRIDRIGSPHPVIHVHCFMPDSQLDTYLKLEERLQKKIVHANAGVGVEGVVIPGAITHEHIFVDADKIAEEKTAQIKRIAAGDESVFEELDRDDAYSGEQFREELRSALLSEAGGDLAHLPWGIGSGHRDGKALSVVFLARAGSRQFFRTLRLDPPAAASDGPPITGDLLESLQTAHCGHAAGRDLPDDLCGRIYDAWAHARADIANSVHRLRDPKNRQPDLPKAQRDAIELLQRSTLIGSHAAVEILVSIWPADVTKALREIVRDDASDEQRVERIIAYIQERGLKPQSPEEVPDIRTDDVKLVCYQLVLPKLK
jgi:superfamily II DNA or RNA helicase